MYALYRRARYIPQIPDREIISTIPAHGSYVRHGVDGDAGGFHSPQSVQDEHIYTKEFSADSYQTSPLENGSWNSTCSSDLLSNISMLEDDFNVGFSRHDGDTNSFLNFSGNPEFALPSTDRTMPPNDIFKDWDGPFSTRPLPPDLATKVTQNQASATKSAGSGDWSDTNLRDNDFFIPDHGSFPLEYRGCCFPSYFNERRWLRLIRVSGQSTQQR
jgi:hypothetical protein